MKVKIKRTLLLGLLLAFSLSFAFTAAGSRSATQHLSATIIGSRSLEMSATENPVAGSAGSVGSDNSSFLVNFSYQSDYGNEMITVNAYREKDSVAKDLKVTGGELENYNLLKLKKRDNSIIIWENRQFSPGQKNIGEIEFFLSENTDKTVSGGGSSDEERLKVIYTIETV